MSCSGTEALSNLQPESNSTKPSGNHRKSRQKPLLRSSTTSQINKARSSFSNSKKYKDFIHELYPNGQRLKDFIHGLYPNGTNIADKIKSCIPSNSLYASSLFNTVMEFFNKSFISLSTTDKIPRLSQATRLTRIVEQFLSIKFSNGNYNRRQSVLTSRIFRCNGNMYGKDCRYIPLQNGMIKGSNDAINYLLSSKNCYVLHQLIGDDILYFLLNKAAIFVPVPSKQNQWWQLTGTPASETMWNRKKKKSATNNKQKTIKNTNNVQQNRYKIKTKGHRILTKYQQKQYNKLKQSQDVDIQHHNKDRLRIFASTTCEICNVLCINAGVFRAHIEGKKHKRNTDGVCDNLSKRKQEKMKQRERIRKLTRATSASVVESMKSRASVLGKRKSHSLNLVNPRRKFRRLNGDSDCVWSRREIIEDRLRPQKHQKIIANTYLKFVAMNESELRRKGLKTWQNDEKSMMNKQNIKKKEIKRYAMFYGGQNGGQNSVLSKNNIMNILPPSNLGSELLIRFVFFGQTLHYFKKKQKELMKTQASKDRKIQRKLKGKLRSISLSQSSYSSSSSPYTYSGSSTPSMNRKSLTQTSTYSTQTRRSNKSLTPNKKKSVRKRDKIDCIPYVPSSRIVRLFGGKLQARYKKLIPFFKKVLINYQKKLKWHSFKHLFEGTEQEKKDKMYWLKGDRDREERGNTVESVSRAMTAVTSSASSSASIFSSKPSSRQSTPGLSSTAYSNTTRCTSMTRDSLLRSLSQPIIPKHKTRFDEDIVKPDLKTKLKVLISCHRPYPTVMEFIKLFLCRVFRHDKHWGFGDANDHTTFKNFIWKLITAQRHEKFSMLQAVGSIKPNVLHQCITNEHKYNKSIDVLQINWTITIRFMWWLINDIIIDAVRFNYYVTERSYTQGPVVTYYSSKIWKRIISVYLKQNKDMFERISARSVWSHKKDTDLGVGFLRFVPKPSSLRPIINLSKDSVIHDPNTYIKKKLFAPNKRLSQLFAVLTHQVNQYKNGKRKEDILGSSVFCVREYYHNWLLFVNKYKKIYGDPSQLQTQTQRGLLPKIYCVSADLSKCYDRINQKVLMDIVKRKLLYKDEYRLMKYSAIFPEVGTIFQRYKYAVDYQEIQDVAMDTRQRRGPFIMSSQGYKKTLSNAEIMKLLSHHVTTSIVYLNGRYYKHNVGISQGSIVSQLLCCVYIGQGEKQIKRTILHKTQNTANETKICRLMMRHVDDFIYFTTDKEEAMLFADLLHDGIDAYNMLANKDKTSTNFAYGDNDKNNRDTDWVSWCGFLWNTQNLNVRAHHRDHTLNIKANLLTSSINSSHGKFILSKLTKLIRHKIQPLLLDNNINTVKNCIYNLYQAFYVSGCRYVTFVISMEWKNEHFLYHCLLELIQYTWNRVKIRMETDSLKRIKMVFPLKLREMQYIAARAYKHSIMVKYHGLFSRAFQQKLNKFVFLKSKCIEANRKEMFVKYTDFKQLMHEKLHDFVY